MVSKHWNAGPATVSTWQSGKMLDLLTHTFPLGIMDNTSSTRVGWDIQSQSLVLLYFSVRQIHTVSVWFCRSTSGVYVCRRKWLLSLNVIVLKYKRLGFVQWPQPRLIKIYKLFVLILIVVWFSLGWQCQMPRGRRAFRSAELSAHCTFLPDLPVGACVCGTGVWNPCVAHVWCIKGLD